MGPTTELAGSRFISKRKTLRGVKERFSIVGNRAILTLAKEMGETDNHSGRPSGSLHTKSRKGELNSNDKGGNSTPPAGRVPPSERTASELQSPTVPELVSIKDHSNGRYLKSRESAMNHMIYYLNQGNDLNGGKEGLKRIDLTKVKPQLISSEEVLTSPLHPSSPKRKIVEYNSNELSELEKRAGHPTRYVGSFSDQSDDENPYLAAAIPGKDIDILEVKNLDKAQILEILEMTREEKRSHQHRIEHLEKRTEALEKIIVAESDQEADATHLIASFRGKLRDLLQQGENFRDQLRKFGELDVIAASPTDQQVLNTIKLNSKHIIQALDDITAAVPENLKPIGKGKDIALFEICPLQLRIPCATMVHMYEISPYVRFPPKTTLGRLQEKYSILTLGRSSTATGHFGGEPLKSPHMERPHNPSLNSINAISPLPASPKKAVALGSGKKLALNLKRSYGWGSDPQADEWVPRFVRCSPRGEPEYAGPYAAKGLQPSSSGFMGPLETGSQNEEADKGRRDTLNSKTSGQGLSFGGSFRKPGGSEINQLDDPELNGLWHGHPSFGNHPALGLETIQELANRSGRGSGCSQDASRQFQEMKAEIAVQKEASAIRAAELFNQNRSHLGQTQTKTRISLGPRLNPNSIKRSPNQFESRGSQREESTEFKRTIAARIFAVGRKHPTKVDTSFDEKPPEPIHNNANRPQKSSWRDAPDKRLMKKVQTQLTPIQPHQNFSSDEQKQAQKMHQPEPYSILDNFRMKQTQDLMSSDACQPGFDQYNAYALGSTTSSEPATQAKNSIAHTSLDQQSSDDGISQKCIDSSW